MLEWKNISKSYGGRAVIADLNLTLGPEKTYIFLGPSGCGKSTLLRILIGLIQPDRGTVSIDGQPLHEDNYLSIRRQVGYVIQNGGLFPHLSACENVAMVARFLQWKPTQIGQRLDELAELTHFPKDGLSRYPAQLSGGQRQRVSLMRALMLDPDVLLLDEPLGALDPMIRADLQTDLRHIFRSLKKTVVMVTHDLHEAAYFADEVILLQDGRIIQRGRTQELLESPADSFVEQFVNAQRGSLNGVQA